MFRQPFPTSLRTFLLSVVALVCSMPAIAQIVMLSSRPGTVSGGDALVEVRAPSGVAASSIVVLLNSNDVTANFRQVSGQEAIRGLVSGLRSGANTLAAGARVALPGGGSRIDIFHTQSLANYPIAGPIISGPHEQPFICQTTTFQIAPGLGNLGPALDANCSVATRADWVYRATDNTWKPLSNLAVYPPDLAQATTNEGSTVPFIVRIETGTVNRSIYQVAMLHDPTREEAPTPFLRTAGWNERLVYTFGGGCTTGWYRQGASTGGALDDPILARGYALASASLNVFGNNCNELLAAETMMMVKERFIENYGKPRYTIGWGCSGGSYQQHQIADNYPGLLDGILPGCSFPEVGFATIQFISDARLLNNYFNRTAPSLFTSEQQRAVTGFLTLNTMPNVAVGAGRITPTEFCPAVLPIASRYNALTNPTGARCDVYDHTVNVYGRDPATGFARRPLDNVGIQYGLRSLNSGIISVDQFLDLNERIGGYDVDANIVGARTLGDLLAIEAAYRSGRLTNGGLGLRDLPIIDYRAYNDDLASGDIHLRYHSFSMRERLIEQNGDADNFVMLVEDSRYGLYSSASPLLRYALDEMDKWIAAILTDTRAISQHLKVVQNKPLTLQEGCMTRDVAAVKIDMKQIRQSRTFCELLYPSNAAPREVAGASVKSDIIKCALKPVDSADYRVAFTPEQSARLQRVFSGGVCNWAAPGMGQANPSGVWQFF